MQLFQEHGLFPSNQATTVFQVSLNVVYFMQPYFTNYEPYVRANFLMVSIFVFDTFRECSLLLHNSLNSL